MHHVTIARLGPIESCEMDIPQFMILTGPQASGKSTIAKVIYYFRTVKDDILDIVLRAMSNENVEYHGTWQTRIKKQLRYKFLRIFGSSWAMPLDMEICYHYTATECIRLYLRQGNQTGDQNYIDFDFGPMLKAYIGELNQRKFDSGFAMLWQLDRERLEQLFDDPYETVFIPAGRSMITLLTDQINYIFTVMDELQRRTIDYCTQAYIERILKLKPSFVKKLMLPWPKRH